MDEQQLREIAEAAFKRQFDDIDIVRINIRQGVGFEDDSPIVDVNIIYDDESGQVTGHGIVSARTELVDKTCGRGRTTLATPASTSSPSPASVSAIRRPSDTHVRGSS